MKHSNYTPEFGTAIPEVYQDDSYKLLLDGACAQGIPHDLQEVLDSEVGEQLPDFHDDLLTVDEGVFGHWSGDEDAAAHDALSAHLQNPVETLRRTVALMRFNEFLQGLPANAQWSELRLVDSAAPEAPTVMGFEELWGQLLEKVPARVIIAIDTIREFQGSSGSENQS